MTKIGLLTPRSSLFPNINFDITNGFKAHLKHLGIADAITLQIENIGFGTDEAAIYKTVENLLLGNDIDIVIAFIDEAIVPIIQPMFVAANKLLLVINMGAIFPSNWHPHSNTLNYSLHTAFHSYLTGGLADSNVKTALATSFYDGGYQKVFSMFKSFTSKGGNISFNHVTPLKKDAFDISPLVQFINQHERTNILSVFSADMAQDFLLHLHNAAVASKCYLYAGPMLFEQSTLAGLPLNLNIPSAEGFVAWDVALINEQNDEFKTVLNEKTYTPNLFSLIGWDAATVIQQYSNVHNNTTNKVADSIQHLYQKKLHSPRGWIQLDENTHHFFAPAYHATLNSATEIIIQQQTIDDWKNSWVQFVQNCTVPKDQLFSAWRNTYLCI